MSKLIHVEDDIYQLEVEGSIRCITKDANGNIVDDVTEKNNILLTIRQPIIRLLAGAMTPVADLPFIKAIGFGSDDTPPTITQTGLIAPISNSRRLIAMAPTISNDGLKATFAVLYDLTEPDIDGVDIKEACLYTADGIAVARTVIGLYRKVTGMYFEFYWTIGYTA